MEELEEGQEPDFPHTELAKLDEMINRPRWVVPVLQKESWKSYWMRR